MHRAALLVTVAALAAPPALIATGCGGQGDERPSSGEPSPGDRSSPPIRVVETEFKLDPATARSARPGRTAFKVVNRGEVVHALAIETPGRTRSTKTIKPGRSRTLHADLPPGRYAWYCPVGNHRQLGMRGTLTVEGATPQPQSEQPAPESPGGGYGY